MMISSYEIKNCVLLEELISYDTHWLRSLSIHSSDLFVWDWPCAQPNLHEIYFILLPGILNMVYFSASEVNI